VGDCVTLAPLLPLLATSTVCLFILQQQLRDQAGVVLPIQGRPLALQQGRDLPQQRLYVGSTLISICLAGAGQAQAHV
jgi:hypothetical protein